MEVLHDLTGRFGLETAANVKLVGAEYKGPPSSYRIASLSQGLVGAVAAASLALLGVSALPQPTPLQAIVDRQHCVAEFHSEQLLTCDGKAVPSSSKYPIGGHHQTEDGWVRIHDGYTHHIKGSYKLATGIELDEERPFNELREALKSSLLSWNAIEFEQEAAKLKLPVSAVRNYQEWDKGDFMSTNGFPVTVTKTGESPVKPVVGPKPLSGTKVLELNRVIAAPVCGKVLAAQGAKNTWVTSPNLPSARELDLEFTKGKRAVKMDLEKDVGQLWTLIQASDVFIQSYAPGSLARRLGVPLENMHKRNPSIIVGTLSAYGPGGKWANKKGFDSLVQAASGMNISEGEYFGVPEGHPKVCPCQVLDHAAGYFLALGIMVARLRQSKEGGSYLVHVSLAGVMAYLRNMGQTDEFLNTPKMDSEELEGKNILAEADSDFGRLSFVSHPVKIDGVDLGWSMMPQKSD